MKIVEAEARFNKFVGYVSLPRHNGRPVAYIKQVSTGAGGARSTDLRAVRVLVVEWGSLRR